MGMPLMLLLMVRTPPSGGRSSWDGGAAGTVHIRPQAHPAPRGRPSLRGAGVRRGLRTGGRFSISAAEEVALDRRFRTGHPPFGALRAGCGGLAPRKTTRAATPPKGHPSARPPGTGPVPPAENAWETACASGSG